MKRLLFAVLLLLWLPPCLAQAGEPLFAVRGENGYWGYIDGQGQPVISFQFVWAEDFRGDYALASQFPAGFEPEAEHFGTYALPDGRFMPPEGFFGVIDRSGQWVVPPEYEDVLSSDEGECYAGGRDGGIYWFWGWENGQAKEGFFDIPSGFFSGLIYEDVDVEFYTEADPELIGVTLAGRRGFVRRSTGETAIPCQYDPLDAFGFEEEYCMVKRCEEKVADGWQLIDRQGRAVPLPENCYAFSAFHEGLAVIWDSTSDLYGFIDPAGQAVIAPQYLYACNFSEGLACVRLQTGEWAMIAPDGEIAFTRWDEANAYFSGMGCSHGLIRCVLPDSGTVVCYDRAGNEAFRLQIDGLTDVSDFKENGVAFYEVRGEGMNAGGVGLLNDRGELLTPPVFWVPDQDWNTDWSEGLFRITELATLKEGYIDARGEWAFLPVNACCAPFHGGLARVISLPDVILVDRAGREIYRYKN